MHASMKKAFLTVIALAAAALPAAAIQPQVTIQGFAYNGSGTPYITPQAAEFKVYQGGNATTAGSGNLYYDEMATISPSASGVFDYALGSGAPTAAFLVVSGNTVPNVLSAATFDTTSAVYLEISVAGSVVLPRIQFRGVPYASLATVAEHVKPTDVLTATTLTVSSGTFTASGPNQASITTSSGIVAGGPITAPAFIGTLYGSVSGGAGSVAAGSVTPGTFGPGALVPAANVIGGLASTNTVNAFPLVQYFPGGVSGSSAAFANGLTASSGTFTASGPNQYSLATTSGIVVAAGGVTAPYVSAANVYATNFSGNGAGITNVSASAIAAGSVTPGTFATGVLVPAGSLVNGPLAGSMLPSTVAYTTSANTFTPAQAFPGGLTASSGTFANGVTAASGTFTASGPNQYSIATTSGIVVAAGGVTAPYLSVTNVYAANLSGNGAGITNVSASGVAAANVQNGTLNPGVLVNAGSLVNGPLAGSMLPSALAYTTSANAFTPAQAFPGGLTASSGTFANGVTAASGTFTASGPNQYSIATTSGIISGGPIVATTLTGTHYGSGAGLTFPNGITASSGTFTASGPNQASITTSSGIVAGGPVTAPAFVGTLYGTLIGSAQGAPPIGALLPYAGTTEPPGWIECNGRSMPQNGTTSASWGSYSTAALFSAIGTVWGSAGAGAFNIPDLRGIFPRGYNHGKTGSYSDPDAATRAAQYASGATGDAIGSYETDQLRSHTHATTGFNGYTSGGSAFTGYLGASSLSNVSGASGGNETRPTNASVMYLIRVQ